jgi:AraC family transcriptional regulator
MSAQNEALLDRFAHRGPGADVTRSAIQSFTVENSLDFGRGCVEVRQYTWLHDTADTFTTTGSYFLDLSITPRAGPPRAFYVDAGRPSVETIGRMMFVPPGRTMQVAGAQGRQRSMHCVLSSQMIDGLLEREPVWNDAVLAQALHLNSPEIEWLLMKIYRELRHGGFATGFMVESLANALAVALIRQFGLEREAALRTAGGLAPWRLRLIRERVQADQPAPALTELAELCGMTVRHLGRAFKAETGQTLGKYVEQAMIERAHVLLAESRAPIGDIARDLGFSSSTSFAYAFRRATGLRPSDVEGRRRVRNRRAA